jgi:flagellin FlaB
MGIMGFKNFIRNKNILTLGVKMYNNLFKNEKAFTGLEAAIVLIAFVVVAAVFSYVMLGAGFFTTQKSQQVVHTGVTQASSSVAPAGDVIVKGASTLDDTAQVAGTSVPADEIIFYVTSTAGGTPIDLDKTIITYTDNKYTITVPHNTSIGGTKYGKAGALAAAIPITETAWEALNPLSTGWLYTGVVINDGSANGDNLLSPGEKYKVGIYLPDLIRFATPGTVGALDLSGANLPTTNEQFTIQVKPPEGAVLSITKTLPAAMIADNYYSVY